MNYIPYDSHERHEYIDRKIAETWDALANPFIVKALSQYAINYSEILESAAVANVKDGIVSLPIDALTMGRDALAVVAVRHDEPIRFDAHFGTQTERQRVNTLKEIRTWGPILDDEMAYDNTVPVDNDVTNRPVVTLPQLGMAMVGTSAAVIYDGSVKGALYTKAPEGVTLVRHRPALILGIDSDSMLHDAEMIHELTHVHDANERPLIPAKSQHSLNMFSLGEELKASAPGAAVALTHLSGRGTISPEEIMKNGSFIQLGLDLVRRRYLARYGITSSAEAYRPSGMLLKMVREEGLESALHQTLNYDAIMQAIDEYKPASR